LLDIKSGNADGDRVDNALIQNAENEIDHEKRRHDEDRRALQRFAECLGVTLKEIRIAVLTATANSRNSSPT
jgi:hypothetical protein